MRAVLAALAALFVTVGSASAADPALVGGTLSAGGRTITVLSQGTVPVHVTMAAESVTLSVVSFDLAPGETRSLTFNGAAVGHVSATMAALHSDVGEAGSATLELSLTPAKVPAELPWQPVGIVTLVLVALALLGRRLRPWRWRLVTV